MNKPLIDQVLRAIGNCPTGYKECLRLVALEMVEDEKPLVQDCRKAIQAVTLQNGPSIEKLDTQGLLNLWRYVFAHLVDDALEDLHQHPLGEADMKRIFDEYYTPKEVAVEEEPYDDVVEDLYLTAVNDAETYKTCMREVQKLMHNKKWKLPKGRIKFLLQPGNPIAISNAETKQLAAGWCKIFNHLIEPAIAVIDQERLCTREGLEAIVKQYMPEYMIEDRFGMTVEIGPLYQAVADVIEPDINKQWDEALEHLKEAQCHFDTVNEKLLEIKMKNELTDTPIKTVTYVYGKDIQDYTADEIIATIKQAKEEIKALHDVGVKSTHIEDQVSHRDAAISKLLEKLDAIED